MTEEKNGLAHGTANSEMAPQEDGTKVPLTDESGVKFNNPPNGDAKIDMPAGQTFSGLTKEELMKYADDPFWIRLRWILFIIFWVGWLAMLVMAIVIIVQAPRCAPKETLEWVQQSPMMQYDINNPVDADNDGMENPEDLVKMAAELGMTTVYLEDLISPQDFEKLREDKLPKALDILDAAKKAGLHVVTDFVPSEVPSDNVWYTSGNMTDFFESPNSRNLDFASKSLLDKLIEVLGSTWKDMGVLGFLVNDANNSEILINATTTITAGLKDVDGAVVHGVSDVNKAMPGLTAESFRDFLDEHINDWSYYKFDPKIAESQLASPDLTKLVTMSLFLVPGTPIIRGLDQEYLATEKGFIKSLSKAREEESVQVGSITFANTTSDVIAFARVMKGTPGCAVAVNLNTEDALVNFKNITGVSDRGNGYLRVSNSTYVSGELGRQDLSAVPLGPYEGIVVLFVPDL